MTVFNPVVDLRKYVLIRMPKSTCPACGQHIFGLAPRDIMPRGAREPFYFLCLCGRNNQAGHAREIAPTERAQPAGGN